MERPYKGWWKSKDKPVLCRIIDRLAKISIFNRQWKLSGKKYRRI
jgi:hypothetical protein